MFSQDDKKYFAELLEGQTGTLLESVDEAKQELKGDIASLTEKTGKMFEQQTNKVGEMFTHQTKQFNERFDEFAAQNSREHDAIKSLVEDHEGRLVALEGKI